MNGIIGTMCRRLKTFSLWLATLKWAIFSELQFRLFGRVLKNADSVISVSVLNYAIYMVLWSYSCLRQQAAFALGTTRWNPSLYISVYRALLLAKAVIAHRLYIYLIIIEIMKLGYTIEASAQRRRTYSRYVRHVRIKECVTLLSSFSLVHTYIQQHVCPIGINV